MTLELILLKRLRLHTVHIRLVIISQKYVITKGNRKIIKKKEVA